MKCKCKRCGYEWKSKLKTPKCCPKCKSYAWEHGISAKGNEGGDE